MAGSLQTTTSEPGSVPEASQNSNYLAIVYQLGKVASTSLVATLNELEGFEAVQTHFMGGRSLAETVERMVNPEVSDYFFEHQLGQFIENVHLTRRYLSLRAGRGNQRLVVISMSREPLEWFRSSVVQDIDGHLPRMKEFLDQIGVSYANDGAAVQLAMTRLMSIFARILEVHGGVDAVSEMLPVDSRVVFAGTPIENSHQSKSIFYLMMRPFSWFEKHFEATLQLRLSEMTRDSGVLFHSDTSGDYFVFRYEDIDRSIPVCLGKLGVSKMPVLQRRNLSKTKYMAEETKIALKSPAARRLQEHFGVSRYCKTFNYSY